MSVVFFIPSVANVAKEQVFIPDATSLQGGLMTAAQAAQLAAMSSSLRLVSFHRGIDTSGEGGAAGPVNVIGARVGDTVRAVYAMASLDGAGTLSNTLGDIGGLGIDFTTVFESIVTVDDQVQQLMGYDLLSYLLAFQLV